MANQTISIGVTTPAREERPADGSLKIKENKPLEFPSQKTDSDTPPDGGYGWVCVACVFVINAHSWGINSAYGVFLSYYLSHSIYPNSGILQYAFIGGVSVSCGFLVSPLATKLIDRYGNRLVLNLGVFLETLAFLGASFATQTWHLFLTQGACFGCGLGFLFVGSVGITPQWFSRKRSVANGINAAGSGFGGLIYSIVSGALIPKVGLPWTFRVLGFVTLVANLTAANLLKDRNKAVGSRFRAFDWALCRRPEFLLFLAWGVFTMLGYVIIIYSMPDFALSLGLSSQQGSIINAVLNLGQALGRPFLGLGSDRFGRINVATLVTALTGVLCFVVWMFVRSMGLICGFAIVVGCIAGIFWATVSPVLAEIIELPDLPSGLSIMWVVLIPPATISEPIALLLRDQSNGPSAYQKVQVFTGSMYLVAATCLWLVRGWKVGKRALQERQPPMGPVTAIVVESPVSAVSAVLCSSQSEDVEAARGPHGQGEFQPSAWEIWSPTRFVPQMIALQRV